MEKSARKKEYLETVRKKFSTPIQSKQSRELDAISKYSEEKRDIEKSIQSYTKKRNNPEVQESAEDLIELEIEQGMQDNPEKKKKYLDYLKTRMRTA